MDRAKMANDFHIAGYSCAQAVVCAFADVMDMPVEQLAALTSCFGGGFRTGEICGVLSGEAMALGVPIVATRTGASEEFLGADEYGIVTGHSDEEIFEGLRRMADDETLRTHYRTQGFQRIGLFSAEQSISRFEALLEP